MSKQLTDESFGIVPVKKLNNKWMVLILKQKAGHWSFPKGHRDKNESPIEAAKRELLEETGLKVKKFISPETLQESYNVGKNKEVKKTVTYFIAIVEGEIKLCTTEIESAIWIDLDEIFQKINLQESKYNLIEELKKLLTKITIP